jgi:hypothetical protein
LLCRGVRYCGSQQIKKIARENAMLLTRIFSAKACPRKMTESAVLIVGAGPVGRAYYDRSPIIAYDGAEHPSYTMNSYTPSTVPGCRTPHLWREDGTSLYDAMGPEFTL